ncbi:MAG: FlgD immunoglobulin-like domain containing protein, partial [Nitrospirota bacterium]
GVFQIRYATSSEALDSAGWGTPSLVGTLTFISDGTQTAYYQVKDIVGLISATITDSIIVDTMPPIVILQQIIDVQVKNDIIIIGTATDIPTQIERVEYRIDFGNWIQAGPNDGKFDSGIETFSIMLVELPDGTHTITARAVDSAGNVGPQTSTTFLVDTQGPAITNIQITPPVTNISPVMTGTVADGYNAPVEVRYWLDTDYGTNTPGYATMTILSSGNLTSDIRGTINVAGLSNGEHVVYVQAKDAVGNWGEKVISKFKYSETGLVVEIKSSPHTPTNQGTVSISGYAHNIIGIGIKIEQIRCMLDNKNVGTCTYTNEFVAWFEFATISTLMLDDGTHTIYIIARDEATNQATATATFFLDRKAPTIEVINVVYPTGQTRVKEGDVVRIEARVKDSGTASGISQVLLDASSIGGAANQIMSIDGATYTAQVTLLGTPEIEDERWIKVKAIDLANNPSEGTQTVFIDNKPPIFIQLTSNKDIYKDGETIVLTAKFDSANGYGSYTVTADFAPIDNSTQATTIILTNIGTGTYVGSYTIGLSGNTIRDGDYDIPVTAKDQANNSTQRDIRLELNNAEIIGVLSANPTKVKDGDTIKFTYIVGQSGFIALINLNELDTTWGTNTYGTMTDKGNGIYELTWTINLNNMAEDGSKTIYATVTDTKGNLIATATTQVYLNNSSPFMGTLATMIRPLPVEKHNRLEIYQDWIEIFGSVTSQVKIVAIWWRNGDMVCHEVVPAEGVYFYFDKIPLTLGSNTVIIFARDEMGNVGSQSVQLYYIEPKVNVPIGPGGGVVENPDGTKLDIPQGALIEVVNITINVLPAEIELEKKPSSDNIKLLGIPHEFGPSGIVFHKSIKLTFVYTDADLERFAKKVGRPINEHELKIFFWDEERHDWVKVGGIVDSANNIIIVYVNHFTIYDGGIDTSPPPSQPAVFVNRNPFKLGEVTEFVADLPDNADKVTIRIFDLSGDLVRVIAEEESLSDKKNQANVNIGSWDGMNDFGNYVGSGIYVYQVRITFTDGSTYVQTKPIGVVK